ncbi:MAG: universal stress protein [Rubrivivax sp.]|nr:universal stress protein [Rubrivivax sp.]
MLPVAARARIDLARTGDGGARAMSRVLVPIDGSSSSLYGVRQVVHEVATDAGLEIHLLNVQVPFSSYVARFVGRQVRAEFHREMSMEALAPARRMLDDAAVAYTVHAEVGDKAERIVAAARRLGCQRIVMGTARKGSLLRWVESSLTNRVIVRTSVPVEVVAGDRPGALERVGLPCALGAGALLLWGWAY